MKQKHILYQFVKNEKVVNFIDQLILAIPNLHIKIELPRITKYGHMKHDKLKHLFTISINNNLSPSKFLYVFLHEYAHVLVAQQFKTYKPHGNEWKTSFFKLLHNAINNELFHPSIVQAIHSEFFSNFVYSRQRDFVISQAIDKADNITPSLYIKDLEPGTTFMLKNEMLLLLLEKRRSRFLCKDVNTNNKYLVSSYAIVDKVIKTM
ncbi:MAG: hypothetical protein Fur0028_05980 [Bacteroidales bacterium]